MKKHVGVMAVAFVLGGVGTAAAIPNLVVLEYAKHLQELRKDPHVRDEAIFTKCRTDVQNAVAEAIKEDGPQTSFRALFGEFDGIPKAKKGDDDKLYLAGADALVICDELETLASWPQKVKPLDAAARSLKWIQAILDDGAVPDSHLDEKYELKFAEEEQACRAAAAALVKSPYKTIEIESRDVAVATVEKTVCDALGAEIVRYVKGKADAEAANKAWWEATAAPYRKAGMAGDRLDYFVSADSIAIYGKGGKELTTPKQKAAAKVTFEVLTGGDGSVTVRRYAWKGNKGAGYSQRNYPVRPGASAFR